MLRGIVGALSHFVRGAAQTVAESRQAATATGVSDEEWWFARSALLEEVAPDFAKRFPMVTRLENGRPVRPVDETAPYLGQATKETFAVGSPSSWTGSTRP